MDNVNGDAVRKFLPPTNQTKLRSVVELCNVYGRLFTSFARVAAPLNVGTKKNQTFEFELNVAEFDAFQEVEEQLMSPPILELPRHG